MRQIPHGSRGQIPSGLDAPGRQSGYIVKGTLIVVTKKDCLPLFVSKWISKMRILIITAIYWAIPHTMKVKYSVCLAGQVPA